MKAQGTESVSAENGGEIYWKERSRKMITTAVIIGIVVILGAVFGLAFRLTGALLAACLWMLRLPLVLLMWVLGAVCCCTILLIPVGLILFKTGSILLI